MADVVNPAPVTNNSSGDTGSNSGVIVGLDQLAALVAALQGSVSTLTSQAGATQVMQTQIADALKSLTTNLDATNSSLKSLSEQVSKINEESDTAFTLRHAGVVDPADDQHRMMADRDKNGNVGLQMVVDMAKHASDLDARRLALFDEYLKYTAGVWTRSLDHFGAPTAFNVPRPPSGPGKVDVGTN